MTSKETINSPEVRHWNSKGRLQMIQLNPIFLEKGGKKEFAVLPFEEFEQIMEVLLDYQDIKDLRLTKSEEETAQGMSLTEVRKEFNI